METASPPVSPRVVATTFTIQNVRVTSGTLLRTTAVVADEAGAGALDSLTPDPSAWTFGLLGLLARSDRPARFLSAPLVLTRSSSLGCDAIPTFPLPSRNADPSSLASTLAWSIAKESAELSEQRICHPLVIHLDFMRFVAPSSR